MILASGGGGEGGVTATCCMPPMTISSDRGMAFEQPLVPARGLAQSAECVDVFGRFARGLITDPHAIPLFLLGLALRRSCGSVHCHSTDKTHIYTRVTLTNYYREI